MSTFNFEYSSSRLTQKHFFLLSVTPFPHPGQGGAVVTQLDITQLRLPTIFVHFEAADATRASEQRLEDFAEPDSERF